MSHAVGCHIFVISLLQNYTAFNSVSQVPFIGYKIKSLKLKKTLFSKKGVTQKYSDQSILQ
jgi:hypothetical protein